MNYPELLVYWIKERYDVFLKKEKLAPRPWSLDPIFQTTYFCNVHRENDRVTRWIRNEYSPHVGHPLFTYNMVLARLLNRISTLEAIGFRSVHDTEKLLTELAALPPPIWGNAYVITTHGQKMGKLAYLAQVLDYVVGAQDLIEAAFLPGPCQCASTASALQTVPGLGSFLAAQVVADLKNTPRHPLYEAEDKATFVAPGPGSLRGLSWFHYGQPDAIRAGSFHELFQQVRDYVVLNYELTTTVPYIDNQDLQNCLCEFDKYCRVKTGTGRSKRNYDGRNSRG